MKTHYYKGEIVSLENVRSIQSICTNSARINYLDGKVEYLKFASEEDLKAGILAMNKTLCEGEKPDPIIEFDDCSFRLSKLVGVKTSSYNVTIILGGKTGNLYEICRSYSSEKAAKRKYQEIMNLIR